MEVRPRQCNCRKTRCLKLYCECFLVGRFCEEGCGCVDCANREEGGLEREQARQSILEKNPLAFQSLDHPLDRHPRGCNCKKSFCQKKYCECFVMGLSCNANCRCVGCRNTCKGVSSFLAQDSRQHVVKKPKREHSPLRDNDCLRHMTYNSSQ